MSNTPTIEQRLIIAGQGRSTNADFVSQTMEAVKRQAGSHTLDSMRMLANAQHARQSWLYRLTRLPKAALIILAFILTISGTAYAAYMFWLSPSAHIQSIENKYGRDQALIDLKNCNGRSPKVTVEITKGSRGTAQGAADSVLAQCEIQAIQNWAISNLGAQPSNVLFALSVTKVDRNNLTTTLDTDKPTTYTIKKDTPVIFRGKAVGLGQIRKGDAVAIIISDNHAVRAVVKLSLAPKYYYSDEVNNSYHDREACMGNGAASCINLPNLDILRFGERGANPYAPGDMYEIQGKLVTSSSDQFTLEATSGKRYTVHTDDDPIEVFNTSNPYGPVTIEPGDVVMVLYRVPKGGDPTNIQADQYQEIQLMLQGFSKTTTTIDNSQKYHY